MRLNTNLPILKMMMMVLCPKAFAPPGDEMSEVVFRCLPHRQLWVSNLSKVVMQWFKVDSKPRPFGCKPQNIPLHHRVPLSIHKQEWNCKDRKTKLTNSILLIGETKHIIWRQTSRRKALEMMHHIFFNLPFIFCFFVFWRFLHLSSANNNNLSLP